MRDTPLKRQTRLSIIFYACLAATVLIAVQMGLILARGEAICFNEGCRTVERLTVIPPLLFNGAGLGYFLLLLVLARVSGKREKAHSLLLLFLLAGMAVEGVLFSYQHYVAKTFCSYCLIILALIFTVNMVAGLGRFFTGLVVATSIFAAFSSLSFDTLAPLTAREKGMLDGGSVAVVGRGDKASPRLYLFFSKECPHCHKVIARLSDYPFCELHLNPIDENIDTLAMVPQETRRGFLPAINRLFLGMHQINVVPVLYVHGEEKMEIIKGDRRILSYLDQNCSGRNDEVPPSHEQAQESDHMPISPLTEGADEADDCTLNEECSK